MAKLNYINRMQVAGRIGNEPVLRSLPNGDSVIELRVATQASWKNKNTDEWETHTEWHDCVAYRKQAEDASDYKKGEAVYLEGRIVTREWTAKDKSPRKRKEVVIDLHHLIDAQKNMQEAISETSEVENVPMSQENESPISGDNKVWDNLM